MDRTSNATSKWTVRPALCDIVCDDRVWKRVAACETRSTVINVLGRSESFFNATLTTVHDCFTMTRIPLAQRPRDLVYFLFFAVCLSWSHSSLSRRS